VYIDDLDIPAGKLTEAAQRVFDRAVEESRERQHAVLASEHLFYAFAQVEWDLFAQAMRYAEVNPHEVLRSVDEHLRSVSSGPLKDGFDRPDGVLLFLGPTGVGKTELAKAVAELLFGDDTKMIRIDMSEYQDDAVSVDKLIGMPRGIAGSERGGTLTNQLKDNPFTVVLLDEIEKASPALLNVFLQAFDEGWMADGRGKRVYLSDAIIIMTSNLGSEHFRQLTSPLGFRSERVEIDHVQGEVRRELERRFSPEFRNRIDDVVLFAPLTLNDVRRIASGYLLELERAVNLPGPVDVAQRHVLCISRSRVAR